MHDSQDKHVSHALRRLAAQPLSHQPPPAAQLLSRVQFRLRYRARGSRENYASSAIFATVAAYALAFLLWNTHLRLLTLSVTLVLTIAAAAAILLCLRIFRMIRS
jgi:hypothetical protein